MKDHAPKCSKDPCVCDGYHTFDELYDHRITLFLALGRFLSRKRVWRSKKHSDGTMWEGWFVMGIGFEAGEQITYHLPLSRWDEAYFAKTLVLAPEFDGHTPDDTINRLKLL